MVSATANWMYFSGVFSIVLAVALLILNIVGMKIHADRATYMSGVWGGLLFTVLGVLAYKSRKPEKRTKYRLQLLRGYAGGSVIAAIIICVIHAMGAQCDAAEDCNERSGDTDRQVRRRVAINVIMSILGAVGALFSIILAVVAHKTEPYQEEDSTPDDSQPYGAHTSPGVYPDMSLGVMNPAYPPSELGYPPGIPASDPFSPPGVPGPYSLFCPPPYSEVGEGGGDGEDKPPDYYDVIQQNSPGGVISMDGAPTTSGGEVTNGGESTLGLFEATSGGESTSDVAVTESGEASSQTETSPDRVTATSSDVHPTQTSIPSEDFNDTSPEEGGAMNDQPPVYPAYDEVSCGMNDHPPAYPAYGEVRLPNRHVDLHLSYPAENTSNNDLLPYPVDDNYEPPYAADNPAFVRPPQDEISDTETVETVEYNTVETEDSNTHVAESPQNENGDNDDEDDSSKL